MIEAAALKTYDEKQDMDLCVLLVDDDERIRQALGLALADEGFAVDEAVSGEDALRRLRSDDYDVVLLDLMLPGVDGLQVCRTLRAQGDLPIIIVTARTDTPDVIAGLEAGADDYVTKPLVASELAARIRALLRRRGGSKQNTSYRVEDLEIWPDEGVVHRGGEEITADPHRVPAARGTGGGRRAGSSPGSSCCRRCGATTTTATPGCSTCTSAGCA